MRNQPETLHEYNIPRLHWWFLITSALLTVCLLLMVWIDYSGGSIPALGLRGDREWKNYQRQFFEIEQKRLAADAKAAEVRANEQGLARNEKELADLIQNLEAKKKEIAAVTFKLDNAKVAHFLIQRDHTMRKADRDAIRSTYEQVFESHQDRPNDPAVIELRDQVETINEQVNKLDVRKQEAEAVVAEAKAELDKIIGESDTLARSIKRVQSSIDLIKRRLKDISNPLILAVTTAPLIEFAASPYHVDQIQTEHHHVDVNFTTVPRVDRCVSCHKSIDRKDPSPQEVEFRTKHKIDVIEWSKLPQPFKSHPRLDLYVSDTSPHPMSTYGCTTCHWGWDRETTFSRAGHTPDEEEKYPYTFDAATAKWVRAAEADPDEESEDAPAKPAKTEKKSAVEMMTQKVAWEKNYHWEEQEFLRQPMRSDKYIQASCLKCHSSQTHLPGGNKIDNGRRLIEQLGCWSCHKMKQLETYVTHFVKPGEDFESICKFNDANPDEVRRINNLPQNVVLEVGKELNIPINTFRKPGPSLYNVASKTNKDWLRKWLDNPVAFRPNTYMPRFWGLDNNKDTPERNTVEINALAEYLFAVSEAPTYPEPPVKGNAETGKKLVGQIGCLGCHVIGDKLVDLKPPANLTQYMDEWQYRRSRSQGPQLAGTGSKTTAGWLFAWLKNPKQYHPKTMMPNLRLSDQEAADVAVYLTTLHNEKTDDQALPTVDSKKLDDVTLEYLEVTLPHAAAVQKLEKVDLDDVIAPFLIDEETRVYFLDPSRIAQMEREQKKMKQQAEEEFDDALGKKAEQLAEQIAQLKSRVETAVKSAKAKLDAMDAAQKKSVFLGTKLVQRYGCFACHNIRGFENAKPIGTELSEWGSKPINKLDFGLVEIEQNRVAWLKQKLHAPRSFDIGRIDVTRKPQELLKMSKFNLNEEQIDQIVTVISGMTDEKLTAQEPRRLTPAEFQIERGRWLAKEMNCVGCHIIENRGGAIRATGLPAGMEPPLLTGMPGQLHQGQRTQPDWLFSFLKAPQTGQIRPWLKVHMPTFGFTDEEANFVVKYFALEGRTRFPYVSPPIDQTPEHLAAGKKLFDQLQCAKCHIVKGMAKGKPLAEIPEDELADLAPPLNLAHRRLQRDWLINKWLPDPGSQIPGVRMPQFEYGATLAPDILGGDGRKQIEALADYLLSIGAPKEAAQATPPKVEKAAEKN